MKRFISWRRVSTWMQGETGLGLAAQKRTIKGFIEYEQGEWVADYEEVYTGTELSGCKELQKAIQHCKDTGCTLMIAKTNRFRNCAEALQIWDELKGNIYFCDSPNSDKFTLTIMFAAAEREALWISIQTKQGIESVKEDIRLNGCHTTQRGKNKGRVVTKLGSDTWTVEQMSKAGFVSGERKREAARENPNNKMFHRFIANYEMKNGKIIDKATIEALVQDLNNIGFKTSTGMDFDVPRFRAMYKKCAKIYA